MPLSALGHFSYGLESAVVWERDREPTITVESDVAHGAQGIDVELDRQGARYPALPATGGYDIEVGGPSTDKGAGLDRLQTPLLPLARRS